jgi:hypothetical protein
LFDLKRIALAISTTSDGIEFYIPYLTKASDIIRQITKNSGPSVIFHCVLEMMKIVFAFCNLRSDLQMGPCGSWILIQSQTEHLLCIGNFLYHFILEKRSSYDCFTPEEVTYFQVFISCLEQLLKYVHQCDPRIDHLWVQTTFHSS